MIPRAVLMAQEVANIGVPASQGNILFNGTDTAVPNTAGVPAWHWADSAIPPGPLPNLHVFTPALRSWQNTSESYYTRGGASLVGYGAPFSYWIPQNNAAGAPTWAQPPHRQWRGQRPVYNATAWTVSFADSPYQVNQGTYPVANSTTEPPIDIVVWP